MYYTKCRILLRSQDVKMHTQEPSFLFICDLKALGMTEVMCFKHIILSKLEHPNTLIFLRN